jgi:hypothetical protein
MNLHRGWAVVVDVGVCIRTKTLLFHSRILVAVSPREANTMRRTCENSCERVLRYSEGKDGLWSNARVVQCDFGGLGGLS